MLLAVGDRLRYDDEEGISELEPVVNSILQQGPEGVHGPTDFWVATFVSVLYSRWGAIYNSKTCIGGTASAPGSIVVKISLGGLAQDQLSSDNEYRLEPS